MSNQMIERPKRGFDTPVIAIIGIFILLKYDNVRTS